MIDLRYVDTKKLASDLAETIAEALTEALMKRFKEDEQGRLWALDKDGKKLFELEDEEEDRTKEKTYDDGQVIKEASEMSLQKKEERLVINLPAWLKDRLKKKSNRTKQSMNEIIRIALTEYLSK